MNNNYKKIITRTQRFIMKYMTKLNDISHDYNHIKAVVNLSMTIAKEEGITKQRDLFHIKMGALLHDYEDSKYSTSKKSQALLIGEYLKKNVDLTGKDRNEIIKIASNISLSKDNNSNYDKRKLKIYVVQDADRINSCGSIGIMRYISYNIINNSKPSFNEIIRNMKQRTLKIKKFLRTKTGKKMAKNGLRLISLFINNYK